MFACRNAQQIQYRDSLEPGGLLERKADAQVGPLRNAFACNVFPVKYNPAFCGRFNAGNELCHGGLTTAIGTCHNNKLPVVNVQIQMPDDLFLFTVILHVKTDVF